MNSNFYIMQQLSQHESAMQSASARLHNVRTPLELVRAVNHPPSAPSYLRCLAQVRTADSTFNQNAERKAQAILSAQVEHLRGLVGSEDFCRESNRFRQDVRLLHHAVPHAARAALLSLDEIRRAVEAQPLPDPDRPRP